MSSERDSSSVTSATSAPRPNAVPARVRDHVAAFNDAVRSREWDRFAARFASDAVMEFVGVPAGPFRGRDSIAAAYRADSPDDTLSVEAVTSDADRDTVRFVWSQGTAGTMELTWRDGLVGRLSVAFDDVS